MSNASGVLKKHNFIMKDISGTVKYSTNRIFALDTVKGTIGKSDFNLTMRVFNGADKTIKKRENYFYLTSTFLDLDEMVGYDFSPDTTRRPGDSTRRRTTEASYRPSPVKSDTDHAKAYNIFTLPFNEFNVRIDVGKIKYSKALDA